MIEIRPAGDGGRFYNYLGYTEVATDDVYPKAQIDNAWDGDTLVGSIVYGPDYGSMWVYHVYVRPEYRGRGVGRMLIDLAVSESEIDDLTIDGDFTDNTLGDYMRGRQATREATT